MIKCVECDHYKEHVTKMGPYYDTEHRCEHSCCYEEVPDPIMGSVIKYTNSLYVLNKRNNCVYFTPKSIKTTIKWWNKVLFWR